MISVPSQKISVLEPRSGKAGQEYYRFFCDLAATSPAVSCGTRSDRLNRTVASLPNGAIFFETDTYLIYQIRRGKWFYLGGEMAGTAPPGVDQRPTGLTDNDSGLTFYATNTYTYWLWSGSAWATHWITGTALLDIHAHRLASPNADLPAGALWIETNRGNVIYQNWTTHWRFIAGTYRDVAANRPTDLGADDNGFRFEATDTAEQFVWDGAAWVSTGVDLSNYYTKAEVDALLAAKASATHTHSIALGTHLHSDLQGGNTGLASIGGTSTGPNPGT